MDAGENSFFVCVWSVYLIANKHTIPESGKILTRGLFQKLFWVVVFAFRRSKHILMVAGSVVQEGSVQIRLPMTSAP